MNSAFLAFKQLLARTNNSSSISLCAIMPPTLNLVDRAPVTLSSAIDQDCNFIHKAGYVAAQQAFYQHLWRQQIGIATVVRHHLNLGHAHAVTVSLQDRWIRGGFNVCIPIEVRPPPSETGEARPAQNLLLRCPLPHKTAEAIYPGTIDEKLGCEVGAYVWIQEQCSDIRIPHLYGFGFSELRKVKPLGASLFMEPSPPLIGS